MTTRDVLGANLITEIHILYILDMFIHLMKISGIFNVKILIKLAPNVHFTPKCFIVPLTECCSIYSLLNISIIIFLHAKFCSCVQLRAAVNADHDLVVTVTQYLSPM